MTLNTRQLVKISVVGEVDHPSVSSPPYRITPEGEPLVLVGSGWITYNVRVGDRAIGWKGDHVEPGASIKNRDNNANGALNLYSCVGNEAMVISGAAKGKKGTVTGKHGGIEHVMVDFPTETMSKLVVGDKIQIKAEGVGLEIVDVPDVTVMNCSPALLKKMGLRERDDKVHVPVTHVVPAKIMGSGLGSNQCYRGDYDIQMFDKGTVEEYGLGNLRFGDIVAITDADHAFGRIYREGAVSVGVVVHGECVTAGHGPGVTSLLTSPGGALVPETRRSANLALVLGLRKQRAAAKSKG